MRFLFHFPSLLLASQECCNDAEVPNKSIAKCSWLYCNAGHPRETYGSSASFYEPIEKKLRRVSNAQPFSIRHRRSPSPGQVCRACKPKKSNIKYTTSSKSERDSKYLQGIYLCLQRNSFPCWYRIEFWAAGRETDNI